MLNEHPRLRRTLRLLLWPALLVCAAVVALYLRLQFSPIRLESGELRMKAAIGGLFSDTVSVEPGRLELLWDGFTFGPELMLSGAQLSDPASGFEATLGSVRLNLQVARLLLGHFVVEDLTFRDLQVTLRRLPDGTLDLPALRTQQAEASPASGSDLSNWMQLLLPRGHSSLAGRLHRLAAEGTTLDLVDAEGNRSSLRLGEFELRRTRTWSRGTAELVLVSGGRNVPISCTLVSEPEPDTAAEVPASTITLKFRELPPAVLRRVLPRVPALERLETEFTGEVTLACARDGRALQSTFRLGAGSATLLTSGSHLLEIAPFEAGGSWSFTGNLLALTARATIAGIPVSVANGRIEPGKRSFAGDLALGEVTLERLNRALPPAIAPRTRELLALRPESAHLDEFNARLTGSWGDPSDGSAPRLNAELSARSGTSTLQGRVTVDRGAQSVVADLKLERFPAALLSCVLEGSGEPVLADFPITGGIHVSTAQNAGAAVRGVLRAGRGSLTAPGSMPGALALEHADVQVETLAPQSRYQIRVVDLHAAGVQLSGETTIDPAPGADPIVAAELRVKELQVPQLASVWPLRFAPKTRRSVLDIVEAGEVRDAQVRFTVGKSRRPGFVTDLTWMEGSGSFRGVEVDSRLRLPHFTRLDGSASFGHQHVDFDVKGGAWNGARVSSARVRLLDLQTDLPRLDLSVALDGAFTDFRPLLEYAPPTIAREIGEASRASGGTGNLKLNLGLPLLEDVQFEDALIDGRLAFSDVTLDAPARAARLAGLTGTLALESRNQGVDFQIEAEAADAQLFGMSDGPLALRLGHDDTEAAGFMNLSVDLSRSTLRHAPTGLDKPAGGMQNASLQLVFRDDGLAELRDGQLTGHVAARVSASWDPANWTPFPKQLAIDELLSGETRASLRIDTAPSGMLLVRSEGGSWDLRPFRRWLQQLDSAQTPGEPAARVPFRVDVSNANVLWLESTPFTSTSFSGAWNATGTIDQLTFATALPGNRSLTAELDEPDQEGVQRWNLQSGDAALALQLAGIQDAIQGGTLKAGGTLADAKEWRGNITLEGFNVKGAPVTARILSAASLTGLVDLMRGRGLKFTRLTTELSLSGDNLVLANTAAHGTEIGILVPKTTVDLGAGTAEFEGTLWPGYALNAGFRVVPLVRDILTGPERQGIVGFSFKGQGRLSDPVVSASALPRFSVLSNLGRLFRITGDPALAEPPAKPESTPTPP